MSSEVKFIEDNNKVSIIEIPEGLIRDEMSPGVYKPVQTMGGFYLERVQETFDNVHLFGEESRRREQKVIRRFKQLDTSMGVMFTGMKGTGKSQTVKNVTNQFIQDGYPCIIIDKGISKDILSTLTTKLNKCVFVFDEFEKNFRERDDENMSQSDLLTFFDGIYSSGDFLFLLTANDEHKILDMYFDRPERIRYVFRYDKLSEDEITEYLNHHDISTDNVVNTLSRITLNFDLLKNIVQELQFGENIDEIVKDLGIEKEYDLYITECNVMYDGVEHEIPISMARINHFDFDDLDVYINIKPNDYEFNNGYLGDFEYERVGDEIIFKGRRIIKVKDEDREVDVAIKGFVQERKELS